MLWLLLQFRFYYCSLLWNFFSAQSLNNIKNLQKRALHFSPNDDDNTYEDQIKKSVFFFKKRTFCWMKLSWFGFTAKILYFAAINFLNITYSAYSDITFGVPQGSSSFWYLYLRCVLWYYWLWYCKLCRWQYALLQ